MANIFEINDPRGRIVICTQECWNGHILINRPKMRGRENQVKETIADPTIICQDANHQNRECFYRLYKSRRRYLKVVVEFGDDKNGRIKTAYPSDSIKAGEKLIWTQP